AVVSRVRLSDSAKGLASAKRTLETTAAGLRDDLGSLNTSYDALDGRYRKLSSDFDNQSMLYGELKSDFKDAQNENGRLDRVVRRLENEKEDIRIKHNNLVGMAKDLQLELKAARSSATHWESEAGRFGRGWNNAEAKAQRNIDCLNKAIYALRSYYSCYQLSQAGIISSNATCR
ncbi:MAG: hypothetical protein OEV68_18430, partial [candidate division Zixibacteria bacterium]|nr:hypothetical protein [candidate division Zixibacteria bacterium]